MSYKPQTSWTQKLAKRFPATIFCWNTLKAITVRNLYESISDKLFLKGLGRTIATPRHHKAAWCPFLKEEKKKTLLPNNTQRPRQRAEIKMSKAQTYGKQRSNAVSVGHEILTWHKWTQRIHLATRPLHLLTGLKMLTELPMMANPSIMTTRSHESSIQTVTGTGLGVPT